MARRDRRTGDRVTLDAEILAEYRRNKSWSETARRFGLDRYRVKRRVARASRAEAAAALARQQGNR